MLTQERDQAQLHRQQGRLGSHSQLAQCGGSVGENHSEETYRGILEGQVKGLYIKGVG